MHLFRHALATRAVLLLYTLRCARERMCIRLQRRARDVQTQGATSTLRGVRDGLAQVLVRGNAHVVAVLWCARMRASGRDMSNVGGRLAAQLSNKHIDVPTRNLVYPPPPPPSIHPPFPTHSHNNTSPHHTNVQLFWSQPTEHTSNLPSEVRGYQEMNSSAKKHRRVESEAESDALKDAHGKERRNVEEKSRGEAILQHTGTDRRYHEGEHGQQLRSRRKNQSTLALMLRPVVVDACAWLGWFVPAAPQTPGSGSIFTCTVFSCCGSRNARDDVRKTKL